MSEPIQVKLAQAIMDAVADMGKHLGEPNFMMTYCYKAIVNIAAVATESDKALSAATQALTTTRERLEIAVKFIKAQQLKPDHHDADVAMYECWSVGRDKDADIKTCDALAAKACTGGKGEE